MGQLLDWKTRRPNKISKRHCSKFKVDTLHYTSRSTCIKKKMPKTLTDVLAQIVKIVNYIKSNT